jgi:hypothetical protein
MPEPAPELRGTAIAMGVIALLLIGVGAALLALGDGASSDASSGVLIRAGAVIGAVALVLPSIRKPSFATLLVAGAGLILVLARPGLIWAALVGWVGWLWLSRQRSASDNES